MTGPVHATALVYDGVGMMIRGPSGAGKSSLALALLDRADASGLFAALVADDRVILSVADGRLIARSPRPIAGLVERYGRGIEAAPTLPAARIRLVIDFVDDAAFARMPPDAAMRVLVDGVELARQPVPERRIGQALALTLAARAALEREIPAPGDV